jgi:hypothetical protein
VRLQVAWPMGSKNTRMRSTCCASHRMASCTSKGYCRAQAQVGLVRQGCRGDGLMFRALCGVCGSA